MLLTDKVKYRNKLIPVNELKPNSDKKVWVMCPSCKMVRQIYWKVFVKSGSYLCHVCANNAKERILRLVKDLGN